MYLGTSRAGSIRLLHTIHLSTTCSATTTTSIIIVLVLLTLVTNNNIIGAASGEKTSSSPSTSASSSSSSSLSQSPSSSSSVFGTAVIERSTTTSTKIESPTLYDSNNNNMESSTSTTRTAYNHSKKPVLIVFSDLDGTLIHYPKNPNSIVQTNDGRGIIQLPPSATGMRGIISSKTLSLCRDIRRHCRRNSNNNNSNNNNNKTRFVLISGMRSSTLIKRLPYLPKADAYVCEAGGRIFYPLSITTTTTDDDETTTTTSTSISTMNRIVIRPIAYDDAVNDDLQPFVLVEDQDWRKLMELENAAGPDGFIGNEVIFEKRQHQLQFNYDINNSNNNIYDDDDDESDKVIPITERKGILWKYARQLQKDGYILDVDGYATCFRMNRKHQISNEKFDQLLLSCTSAALKIPSELSTSTNLGCIDYYPISSGKKNCCDYIAKKFIQDDNNHDNQYSTADNRNNIDILSEHCICLCDDDNDIEMALACNHAYIPYISSKTMEKTIEQYPAKFTATTTTTRIIPPTEKTTHSNEDNNNDDYDHTVSTEAALQLVLERIRNSY